MKLCRFFSDDPTVCVRVSNEQEMCYSGDPYDLYDYDATTAEECYASLQAQGGCNNGMYVAFVSANDNSDSNYNTAECRCCSDNYWSWNNMEIYTSSSWNAYTYECYESSSSMSYYGSYGGMYYYSPMMYYYGGGCEYYNVHMSDTYGDGWNGIMLHIGEHSLTMNDGFMETQSVCLYSGSYSPYTCDGSYASEATYWIEDPYGNQVFSGGGIDCEGSGGGMSYMGYAPMYYGGSSSTDCSEMSCAMGGSFYVSGGGGSMYGMYG